MNETGDRSGGPLRLGVLLSGGGRTLLNILDEIKAGRLEAEVAVVIASRDCKGVERSRAAGLDVEIVPYKQMPDVETYTARLCDLLDAAEVDLVCQAGFLSLWRIPERYEGRVMNIHPALLPSFGGKGMWGHHVHEAVLARGCKVSGCTVHFVTNEYDAGPIIVQRCVPVLEGDMPDELAARVFEQECKAYPEAIRLFGEGRLRIEGGAVRIRRA
jgi:phosphoribosylglycinamide formyltransferase-1